MRKFNYGEMKWKGLKSVRWHIVFIEVHPPFNGLIELLQIKLTTKRITIEQQHK